MVTIAWCFYGQPRKIHDGHNKIKSFLGRFDNCSVDYFYHTWALDPNGIYDKDMYYEASPWRNINREELRMDKNIINKINELYNPVEFVYDFPIKFDIEKYQTSMCYLNSNERMRINTNNTLSQFYSKNRVRDLLYDYTKKNNKKYDCVIMSRFDNIFDICKVDLCNIDLHNLDTTKIYVPKIFSSRSLVPDFFTISNMDIFFNIFNVFNNLDKLIDNTNINKKMESIGEKLIFNPEELSMANLFYCYDSNIFIILKLF